ncbi:MAG: hypothetical protein M5R40_09480 [Anaerolineae bacterium]|nr:hypothetical protein [Anaerolineae bacterium]
MPAAVALALGGACAVTALAGLPLDFIPLTDHDVTPERLQLYEYFSGNIGTTIRYEWLPNTVNPRPYTGPDLIGLEPRAKPLSGEGHGHAPRAGRGGAALARLRDERHGYGRAAALLLAGMARRRRRPPGRAERDAGGWAGRR